MDDTGIAPARHKLDVDDFYRMAEAGILKRHDRVELIDGELIDMEPIGQGHEATVGGLNEALVLACAGRAIVWPQNSLRLNRLNVPQPDFTILHRRADLYATGERPTPKDVLLLVEVADSSLNFDRTVKLPLYAQAGIAEYWIVDLKRKTLFVHRKPAGDGYGDVTTHVAGERIALALAPEIVVSLDLMFPG
jgi:Uma2 family endonuclease